MRPQILFPLFAPSRSLKGVGPRITPLVERAAGPLVRDLMFLTPQGLVQRPRVTIAQALEGETAVFSIKIEAHFPPERAGRPYRILAADPSGSITLTWFRGHGDHLRQAHPVGSERAVSGRIEIFNGVCTIAHPDYLLPLENSDLIPAHEPVYPTTAGLPSKTLRRLVGEALNRAPDLPEWQDGSWLQKNQWPSWRQAIELVHGPADQSHLSPRSPARLRLAYDELLAHQLAVLQRKAAVGSEAAAIIPSAPCASDLLARLPYTLTSAQRRSLDEIRKDLSSGLRMSRILQGDVGSGKTIVAMLAMADVAGNARQAALMAPTDILARQHFDVIEGGLSAVGITAISLTGRDKGAVRRLKLEQIRSGDAQVVVGTHALFQDDVVFARLSLAIIDEQHRFGVSERQRLQSKGGSVHMLALSATPIPRTLELTVFGDLDVSKLDEKPPGRKPVTTTAAPFARLDAVVERLRKAVAGGAQAFWICPLVSESELLDVTAAEVRADRLRAVFADSVGLIHGKLPASQKDQVMTAFAEGRLSVLVATTVVEVGVNVPRASIMVIEHAERFGLAQLHQLRGRVGRGDAQSACLLLYDPPLSPTAQARLEILRQTDDGFLIAERDLELRGGGDLMGLKQSGFPDYRFADPQAHRDLLLAAADDARLVLGRDPDFTSERGQALEILQALFDWRSHSGWASGG